jgi:hypothetical protein
VTQPYEPEQSATDVVVIDEAEDEDTSRSDAESGNAVLNGTIVGEPADLADSDNRAVGADPDSDEDDLILADAADADDDDDDEPDDEPSDVVVVEEVAGSYEPSHAAGDEPSVAASREWLDIQAMFVDDPSGAVRLAAAQADSAVSALVTALQEQQAALAQAGGTSGDGPAADPGETEQLRSALRGYRSLCQSLAGMGASLPAPESRATAA